MEEVNYDRPFGLRKLDSDLLKSFNSTLKELRGLVISNIEFFQRGRSALHARFYASSCILLERTQILEPLVLEIVPHLYKFDFSEEVPGNGYRSFISLLYRCSLYLVQLCRHIHTSRSSLFFQSSRYCKDLESYVETLSQLVACLNYLKQLMTHCSNGDLFMTDDSIVGDNLLLQVEMINVDCFYGRCLGFQFCATMQKVLHAVIVVMATFSECYDEPSQVMQLASSVLNSGKYVFDQELRARQVVNITRTGDIKFCKAFWSIPESPIFSHLRSFTFAHVEVNDVISLDPVNFEIPSTCSDETVTITPPCAHIGPAPVKVRLISHAPREGQDTTRSRFRPKMGSSKPPILPKSPSLLFHCHGGGFVAQSSQSHENYLRMWARELEVPILSVDYSLAPDYPFPRALEECFYAYAWALKNPTKLGWTGERVCFAGDSAGANLVISTALRAVSFEIRVPDGIVSMYAPILIQYSPSPSRFMAMIDPLLPIGILMRCIAAYAGIADEFSSALAKPIFCNPGTVEPWEMVDSKEMQHIEDYVGEIKPHSADGQQTSQDDAHQEDGDIQTSVSSNLRSNGTENLINDVENENTETDGAQEINVITHYPDVDGSICECTSKNGCEFKSKAQNDQICDDNGATFGPTNSLPMNKVDVDTQSNNKDSSNKKIETKVCKADNEDDETGYTLGDIVFVESEMIPDVIENVDNQQHGLTSSRILNFVRKENPVKSIVSGVENPVKSLVSGVKSFMSRHKKAKLSTPEMDAVPKKNATEETSEKSLEKEQFESDVDDGSPSKFKNNGKEVNSHNHSKTSLNEEVAESILKHKIESETLLINKNEDISEDLDGNVDNKEYHRINHENITNPNCKSETEFIESDNNNLTHTENLLADSEYSNNDCSDHEKQTDKAKLVKPETELTATIDCTNSHQVCESDMEVSDYSDKNENMIDTNENVIETESCTVTDTSVNDTSMEYTSQYTESSNVGESSDTKSLIIKIPQDDIVEDNKHNDRGDDDDDNDDDDPEDMETFLESISHHAEDTAMYSISSETGAKTQSKDEKQSKHIVDSVTTDLAAMNAENCDISEESNLCNSEIYENRNEITSDDTETFVGTNETNNPAPSELYAVCQELLDEATCHSQDIGASGYNDSIIASSSCHTIEDRSSYYFYGYDRKLSIHSEGSCDSIEDSHAWMTGQDIDIVEVDSNDIVTVINDCDQNTLRDDLFLNNRIEFDEAKFYIDTADQGIASLSENKAKTFSGTVSNDLQSKTCSAADNQSDLKYEKNTENMNSKAFVKEDKSTYEKSVINEIKAVKSETVKDEHNPKTDTASEENVDENAGHVIRNDLDFVSSDGATMSDVGGLTIKDNKEKCDKAKTKSDPTEHTTGIENNTGLDTTMKDVRLQNRRAMSLDLTNDLNSFANNADFLSPMRSMTLPRSSTVPELLSGSVAPKLFSVQRNIAQSPIQLFRRLPIVKNPYMSPILAPDEMIQGLPMVYLIACHFDPLLDDSVMFARKLRDLGKDVSLHIVDNLPHGFLNFTDASPEAKQACKYCLHRIMDVLKIEHKT